MTITFTNNNHKYLSKDETILLGSKQFQILISTWLTYTNNLQSWDDEVRV